MNKKIILFDIDETLMGLDKMAVMFYEKLAKQLGITTEKIIELKEQYKKTLNQSGDYLHSNLILFLKEITGNNGKEIEDPFEDKENYKKSLHPEVKENVKKLSKNFRLGVYSEGFYEYQKKKVYWSGIGDFFDEKLIFITQNKSDPEFLKILPEGAIIIDDKKSKIEKLKEAGRFNLVWINRKDDEVMDDVKTVKDLNEFADLLKQL